MEELAVSIRFFVSSSPDLALERDLVGQVVAELPLMLGWQIDHTPLPGGAVGDSLEHVAQCDLYAVILGQDFSAPMGAELQQALVVGRQPLAYRKRCTLSPSAQDAVRRLDVRWRTFSAPSALRTWFTRDLLRALLEQAVPLGLDLAELERLLGLAQDEADRLEKGHRGERERGEAGRSGVILGREVWEDRP
jgi:hypothetical protein